MVQAKTVDSDAKPSSDRMTLIAAAVAIGAAVILGMTLLPRLSFSQVTPAADRNPAPTFQLPVVHNGEPNSKVALAELKGSPVLLDFWATWCGPCRMQTPILDRVARRYQDKGLKVVGVNVVDDDHGLAKQYAEQKGLTYPIVVDDKGLVQREYNVNRLPTMVLIDREGRIVKVTNGVVDEAGLDKLIQEVM